jgi:hypothetical protein
MIVLAPRDLPLAAPVAEQQASGESDLPPPFDADALARVASPPSSFCTPATPGEHASLTILKSYY